MLNYEILKTIHVLFSTLFLGGGAVSAFFKLRAWKTSNLPTLLFVHESIVVADYVFTIPSAIGLPLTGILMVNQLGIEFTTPWIMNGLILYFIAGLAWLPAAFLQIKMKDLIKKAIDQKTELEPLYYSYSKIWLWLGIPSFLAAVSIFFVMIRK